jgi:hypothetical protein
MKVDIHPAMISRRSVVSVVAGGGENIGYVS